MRREIPDVTYNGEVRASGGPGSASERTVPHLPPHAGSIHSTDDLRIPHHYIATRGHVRWLPEPHVLVRRRRIPVDPRGLEVGWFGREHFDRKPIGPAAHRVGDVELDATIRARDGARIRETLPVEPDVRTVVDAVEVQRKSPAPHRRRNPERRAIPPWDGECARGLHSGMHKVRADLVRHPRELAEVHPEERIAVQAIVDKRTSNSRRHRRTIPAGRIESRRRHRRAVYARLRRRLDEPAGVQHQRLLRVSDIYCRDDT